MATILAQEWIFYTDDDGTRRVRGRWYLLLAVAIFGGAVWFA